MEDFRLLHVYYSTKRASTKRSSTKRQANKVEKSSSETEDSDGVPPRKRQKRSRSRRPIKSIIPSRPSQPASSDQPRPSETGPRPSSPAETSLPSSRPSPCRSAENKDDNKENKPEIKWMTDSLSYITPEVQEFGPFHPIHGGGERSLHPYLEFDNLKLTMEDPMLLPDLTGSWEDPCMPPMNEEDTRIRTFADKLDQIHESLKEAILTATRETEQGQLVSLVSDWAMRISLSPLGREDMKIARV